MDNIFNGLSLIIVIGAAVALLMRIIGQPLMIGHILTGIIVGPALLHILKSPDTLATFGNLGIALLLFIIGLGMNPKVIKEVGRTSAIVATAQVIITTTLGYFLLSALGLSGKAAWLVAIGLSINSTIVALKLLNDKREQGRLFGKLTIGTSLADDILAAIALLLVASARGGQWLTAGPLMSLAFKGALIGAAMFFVTVVVLPKAQKLIASDQELLFLTAIAWGLGSAALLAKAGFSLEVGALAAGISIATLPYAQEIAARLRPLRDFFVIVFFIALGSQLTFNGIGSMLLPILVGTILVVVFKPIVIMGILGILGYTKRTSFKTAVTLSQVSEFSIILVILGVQQGLVDQKTVSMLTFIALISIAISTYLVIFSEEVYAFFEKYLGVFERKKTLSEAGVINGYELVLFGYQKGGHEFVELFKQMGQRYVVIDYDPEVIDILEHHKINHLYGDATDVELLQEAGIAKAKLVVSIMTDFQSNLFLVKYLDRAESNAVIIVEADNPHQATELYEHGASYVILPHFIGSEHISAFVKKSGLQKMAFRKERAKHLRSLERQLRSLEKGEEHDKKLGHTIIESVATLTKVKN